MNFLPAHVFAPPLFCPSSLSIEKHFTQTHVCIYFAASLITCTTLNVPLLNVACLAHTLNLFELKTAAAVSPNAYIWTFF